MNKAKKLELLKKEGKENKVVYAGIFYDNETHYFETAKEAREFFKKATNTKYDECDIALYENGSYIKCKW